MHKELRLLTTIRLCYFFVNDYLSTMELAFHVFKSTTPLYSCLKSSTVSGPLRQASKREQSNLSNTHTTLIKMVKIVASFELTLKKKIEALEAEVARLRVENERQKKEITRLGLQALGKHSHETTISSKALTVETPSSNLPSYSRPTVASTNRAWKPTVVGNNKTVDDRSRMYVDGKLFVINKPRPSYMKSTCAKDRSGSLWDDWSKDGQEEQTLWVTHSRPVSPIAERIRMRYDCESCNKLEADFEDESAH